MSAGSSAVGAGEYPDSLEAWLDEATAWLQVDPEIALEVRSELKSHYDDAYNDYIRSGSTAREAQEAALKSLGHPRTLGKQLLKANRSRLNMRAVTLWAARVVLPVVAVIVIIALSMSAITSAAMMGSFSGHWQAIPWRREVYQSYRDRILENAPADVKLLYRSETDYAPALAKDYLDLNPDDRAAYFNFAQNVMMHSWCTSDHNVKPDPGNVLKVLGEGEKRDPGNAFYPYMAAYYLLDHATSERDEGPQTQGSPWAPPKFAVTSQKELAEGLEAFHRAAQMPLFHTYSEELLQRKLAVLPSSRMSDVCFRLMEEMSVLLPHLNGTRQAANVVSARAALSNNPAMVADIHSLTQKMAADSKTLIELLVTFGIDNLAYNTDEYIAKQTGNNQAMLVAQQRLGDLNEKLKAAQTQWRDDAGHKDNAGLIFGDFLPQSMGTTPIVADLIIASASRWMEYDALDAFTAAFISCVLLAIAVIYGARSWLHAARTKEKRDPRLMLSGKDLLKIVGLGAVLPLAIFAIYTRALPIGGRGEGLMVNWLRELIEFGILLGIILLLVDLLAERAVRRRAKQIGIDLPRRKFQPRNWSIGIAAILSLFCLGITAASALGFSIPRVSHSRQGTAQAILLIVGWSGLFFIAVQLYRRLRSEREPFASTVARSLFVPTMLAAFVVGITSLPLNSMEKHHVQQIVHSDEPMVIGRELTGYAAVRQAMLSGN